GDAPCARRQVGRRSPRAPRALQRARDDVRRGEPRTREGGARAPRPDEGCRPRPARTDLGRCARESRRSGEVLRGPVNVKLAVLGANGRMGRAVVRLAHEGGMKVVCAIGAGDEGKDAGELAGVETIGVRITSDIDAIATSGAEVLID